MLRVAHAFAGWVRRIWHPNWRMRTHSTIHKAIIRFVLSEGLLARHGDEQCKSEQERQHRSRCEFWNYSHNGNGNRVGFYWVGGCVPWPVYSELPCACLTEAEGAGENAVG